MRGRDAFNGGNERVTKDHHLVDVSPEFKDKVFTIADEVLKILKELSLENKTNIDSNQIAERMFWKDSLQLKNFPTCFSINSRNLYRYMYRKNWAI
jgi:hypothetical protein